jgi:hypothetical protein
VGLNEGRWAVSSGAVEAWKRLNRTLGSSLEGAVAADFDGNGKTDIAWSSGQTWVYSRDGRAALATLRNDDGIDYPALKDMLIGQFGADPDVEVVSFDRVRASGINNRSMPGERLVIWSGLGSGNAFWPLSAQNMR